MKLPIMMLASPTVMLIPVKSIPPVMIPRNGVITSPTKELTIAVNAPPMIIPTAMLITSPFAMNALNSFINFFTYLLKNINNKEISKNFEYKNLVNSLNEEHIKDNIEVPEKFEDTLRFYQKVGFKWLKTLDFYNFGGILADDMGLGKTIQVISMISDYVENNESEKKTSLVVAPS